jgi:hypothetical protein
MPRQTSTSDPLLNALPKDLRSKVVHLPEVDVYLIQVDPRTLKDNPKNWRIHTQRQRSTFNAFKEKYGWLAFPIYNVCTSRLVDGHMRVEEAIKQKEKSVPVILKYLTELQENEVLASFDTIGLLAKRNDEALRSLTAATQENLTKVRTKSDQRIAQLTKDLSELSTSASPSILLPQSKTKVRKPKEVPPPPEIDEPEDSFEPQTQDPIIDRYINGDLLFPGTTWLGIPTLLSDRLATPEVTPTRTYAKDQYGTDAYYCVSSGPFEEGQEIGTLGFYTEDDRFEDAYSNAGVFAEFLENLDPLCIISPDFSTYSDWPMVMRLWNVYRSRWTARFWQELGYNIIPSIQHLGSDAATTEYVLDTLPPETPVLSIQCRKSDIEGLRSFIELIVSVRKPKVLLLYGGEEKQKYLHGTLPFTTGRNKIDYRYLMQYTEKRRRLRKLA